MNRKLTAVLLAAMLLVSAAALSSCKITDSHEEPTPESEALKIEMGYDDNDFDDPTYYYEQDGADPITIPHTEEDFYGNWAATSKRAAYMYGNVNIKIREDGTWKGNITEEDFHGKWRYTGTFLEIKDTQQIIHWKLFYNSDGILMCDDLDDPGDPLVLERGPAV